MLKISSLIFLLILFILSGAGITIILKHISIEKGKGINFSHDYFIVLLMFFSEMSGLPLYCILSRKLKKNSRTDSESIDDEDEHIIEEVRETNIQMPNKKKVLYSIVPFIFDNIASILSTVVLYYLPGSIYMMIKGLAIIIFTLIFSKFILKNNHIIDHYISVGIASIGFIFVGIDLNLSNSSKDLNAIDIIIGIVFILMAMISQSFQYIYQEYYMKKYMIDQFFMIGFEGLFGFIFNLILCFCLYFIKCDEKSQLTEYSCVKDDKGIWRVENIFFCFEQIFDNKIILILMIILIIPIVGFNLVGISIIKYKGAVTRSLIDNFKTFIVWIYFLFPWVDENLKEKFDWFRLGGLIITLAAILIYFGIFKIDERITIRRKMKELSTKNDAVTVSEGSSINEPGE